MSGRYAPLTTGSPTAHSVSMGPFNVTGAWFPSELELAPHRHERTSFGIMLEGSFDLSFTGKTVE